MTTILFDLDGTLIDSTEAILEGFHLTFEGSIYTQPTDEAIKALIGHPLDIMYRDLGVDEKEIWDFVHRYKAHYQTIHTQKTVLLPSAQEAIAAARKFARLGVVTTKTGKFSRELLEHFGVMDAFEILIGREDVEHPKPHPEPIDKAIKLMHADKEHTWMIGDTRLDMESANNAGIRGVAVTSGYDSHAQLADVSEHIYPQALQAVEHIAHYYQSVKG